MRHVRALAIKFVMVMVMLFLVLGLFYGVNFGDIFWTSVILTVGAYLIGDLFILPMAGNITATLADFGLAFAGVWLIGAPLFDLDVPLLGASLASAIAIAAGEWFFHRYMRAQILRDRDRAAS